MSNFQRILIIDDQEHIHHDYQKVIGRTTSSSQLDLAASELFGDAPPAVAPPTNFQLDSAFQGQEGLARVVQAMEEGRPYALAFVDIRMPPGWDGIETVRRIWEVDPEILIVLCSAYSDYSWEQIAGGLGRTDRYLVLRKPFDNIEVRQCAMALTERWSLARKDPLTGLLNRRVFHEHLQRAWAAATATGPLACVMIDIDHFKRTNDLLGHQAGDEILRQIGKLLPGCFRPGDIVCRYGGEEIVALLPNTGEAKAAEIAEAVRLKIAETPLQIGATSQSITVSIGISEDHGDTSSAALVERADQALRIAKQSGRNRATAFSTMDRVAAASERFELYRVWADVPAERVMAGPGTCLPEHLMVDTVVQCFLRWRIESAPVVDADGNVVGIVSESDLLEAMLSPNGWSRSVAAVMQRNVVCYDESASVQTILDFLLRSNTGRVVITRGKEPLGILSRGSILRWFGYCFGPSPVSTEPGRLQAASRGEIPGRVDVTLRAIVERTETLAEHLETQPEDPVPPIIDCASKLQELINDLLADAVPQPF